MYKKRINDWQLFKNQKAAEKEQIVQHLEAHRKLGVDLGQPMIRGQEVKEHKITRHLRGKRKADGLHAEPAARDRDTPVSDPSTRIDDARREKRARIRRRTSCHAISFSRITDPAEYRNTENLLIQMDHYFCSKLENNPWTAWDIWCKSSLRSGGMRVRYTYQQRTYICTFKDSYDLYQRYLSGAVCLSEGRTREGWKLIHEGAEMIRPCLLQEHPHILGQLLRLLVDPVLDPYAEILKLLLGLIASMASVVYGERHPISKLCHALQACCERKDVVYLAQRKLLDTYSHHLGKDHHTSLEFQSTLLGLQVASQEAKRVCCEFITFCEIKKGRNSFLTRWSLYELARLCYRAWEDSEAVKILVDVLERGKDHSKVDSVSMEAHSFLGLISESCEDYGTAEQYLWIGLSRKIFSLGPQHPRTTETYISYQRVAERQGASQEVCRGYAGAPEVLCETSDEPVWRFSRRRANSLPGEYSLDCPCYEPARGHGHALKVRCDTFDEPLRDRSRKRANSLTG
jgi:hypothetical protein